MYHDFYSVYMYLRTFLCLYQDLYSFYKVIVSVSMNYTDTGNRHIAVSQIG